MENDAWPDQLVLSVALVRWCNREVIVDLWNVEREFSARELASWPGARLGPVSALRDPSQLRSIRYHLDFTMLRAAWETLIIDFQSRIERGELHLEGVEVNDDPNSLPQAIRGAYASMMKFDFMRNAVILREKKYVAIRVSQIPSPRAAVEGIQSASRDMPHRLQISDLTDEQILVLLNRHIQSVIDSDEPKMMARIKDVLQPIIMRRLQARAERRELLGTLAAEAQALRDWIRMVAPWHPIPKSTTIENNIRQEYGRLRRHDQKAMISG